MKMKNKGSDAKSIPMEITITGILVRIKNMGLGLSTGSI